MTAQHVNLNAFRAGIDAYRSARGLSWRDVGAQSGMTTTTLSRFVNGHRIDLDGFAALVRWLGVPAETFMPQAVPPSGPLKLEVQLAILLASDPDLTPPDRQLLHEVLGACMKRIREGQRG